MSEGQCIVATQPTERETGLEKQLVLKIYERGSRVSVEHRLVNRGDASLSLAPWALSAMAPGGVGIFPQAPFVPHPRALAPARPLVLWPFTRMNDVRFCWGDRFILLRQDSALSEPQKFGFFNDSGYMAYARADELFVKCHLPRSGPHADFGCNAQTFTNELFLELESLGPCLTLEPGESVSHSEQWFVFSGFEGPVREPCLVSSMRRALVEIVEQLASHGDQPELVELLGRNC